MSRQVISLSLYKKYIDKLDEMSESQGKSRSQLVRELIERYDKDRSWERIFKWGGQTAKKFNIKSEEDVLKIIND